MKLISFNLSKINAEKISENPKEVSIDTGIDVLDIGEVKTTPIKTKENLMAIKFEYKISYKPEFAKISFIGTVLLSVELKESKEVFRQWKEKKIPDEFKLKLLNLILRKSSIRALQLEEELGLPSHFQMPFLKPGKTKEE